MVVAVVAVVIGRGDDHNGALPAASVLRAETPATVTVTPGPDAVNVDPLGAVMVSAANGTLSDVQMVNDQNTPIPGVMTPDHLVWKPSVPLGYGRSYTLTVASRGPTGTFASQMSRFTTLTPSNQAAVSLTTTSGAALRDGGTYGVGTVIVAHFDEPIIDRTAAQRRLTVTTAPAVDGSWYWVDDQNAHWRPEHYYAAGTKITVAANIYGAPLGGGLYGQEDQQTSFTIGDSHVSIADDNTKQVNVYNNGVLVRTMPTSMGMGGTQTVAGQTLTFWTPPGVYTVMDKSNPVVMDSSTYGLPVNSHLGYRETINYATRISPDGIYLHQLDSTVWAQGNTNTSHGCLNLNGDNAKWFFGFSQPGDIVEVRNTGGPPLSLQNNGDWSVPWAQWQAGSAPA
ncbi:Ig-like domain-containing protein (plasmid) [Mycobacterium intracellulare subsp. chimaera]|nr:MULTISPECIES: Ig-like domain-containing protein [Mycobacterium avium complex (MAC)]ETZ40473.1 L,D-transpeptidase catalytic domain protein [Mycobacterium intracellulare MIN_052511_1280]MCF1815721.1 Ig-like domain-containing protein [Mycobacterium intracellulare subsp. intracellulare]MDM3909591.1 Ig-like domain-containing protein [Mycobacterium intracellulare subsp. chimaera]MDM3930363.1 Ig-like domain-containing protein [Mycobacterium intracellulare subsp. chimaera]MDM3935854.1 Ig-like domai